MSHDAAVCLVLSRLLNGTNEYQKLYLNNGTDTPVVIYIWVKKIPTFIHSF